MTATRAPARIVSLGLGAFSRAHPGWYTAHAGDAEQWGIAAFTGRRPDLAEALRSQDGRYTVVTRAGDADSFETVHTIVEAHPAADHAAWLARMASPEVGIVLLTVTEAGYCRDGSGALDRDDPTVAADITTLQADPSALVRSAPGRLVAGLAARRGADGGPIALVSCDNLPGNGAAAGRVVIDLADAVDPSLVSWINESVAIVSTMADRITPHPTAEDIAAVAQATGRPDAVPVITEPFHDWVLEGAFPAGRPAWQDTGAEFVDDVVPFEQRKLWLLNGGHSLLAYLGSIRGHETAAEALADAECREWLLRWWSEAGPHVTLPAADVADYQDRLLDRLANPRIAHRLSQIAIDGSEKLPVRVLPTLRAERDAGRMPVAAAMMVAAWAANLRGAGTPVVDARAATLVPLATGPVGVAAQRVLASLDPALADDHPLVDEVAAMIGSLEVRRGR